MKTFETLEQSLKTKNAEVINTEYYKHDGVSRKSIKVKKSKGERVYTVIQYESGLFSSAV